MIAGKGDPTAPKAEGAMMSKGALGDYRGAADKLTKDWGKLSPLGRAESLVDAANEALSQEKIPGVDKALKQIPNPAHFESINWLIAVKQDSFEKPGGEFKDKKREIHNLASDVFHEGRHAEQRFTIARQMASQDAKATQASIAHDVGIPDDVAAKAVELRTKPLEPVSGDENKTADGLKDDAVDHKPEHKSAEDVAPLINATMERRRPKCFIS